jgi:hypothetical protein
MMQREGPQGLSLFLFARPQGRSLREGRGNSMDDAGLTAKKFSNLTRHGIPHGVYARTGGQSPAPYRSLNVGLHVGDSEACVLGNRELIREHLALACLVSARQVHGDRVWVVAAPLGRDVELEGYDALVTDRPGIGLMIQQADCQAVLLHDPRTRAVANIHSGWRGSVLNIIARTVEVMQEAYGTRPADLVAAISPSLGPCCAEFRNHARELPADFQSYQVRPDHFDFWAISRDQLLAAGLRREQIEIAGDCTKCDENFFSYRRERITGRFASVIATKKE